MGAFSFNPGVVADWDNLLIQQKKEERKKDIEFRKQAIIEELRASKDNIPVGYSPVFDGDTISLEGNSGRFAVPNVSFDTAETFKEGQPYKANVLESHRLSLAANLGIPPEMVTEDMLYALGEKQKQKTASLLSEGFEDPNKVNVQVTEHGQDIYKRDLVEPVNPKTGVNLIEELNTPEDNLNYFSKYNRPQDANYAKAGDTTRETYRIEQTGEDAYTLTVRGKDQVKYKTVIDKSDRAEDTFIPEFWKDKYGIKAVEGKPVDNFTRTDLSKQELEDYLVVLNSDPTKPLEKGIGEYDQDNIALEYTKQGFIGLTKIAQAGILETANDIAFWTDAISEEEYAKKIAYYQAADDSFAKMIAKDSTVDERVHTLQVQRDEAMSTFDYISDLVSNRKEEAFSQLAQSAGLMLALTQGARGYAVASIDTHRRIIDEFKKLNNGEAPTLEQTAAIAIAAFASTGAEKLGLMAMLGKIPGLDKLITKVFINSPAATRALVKILGITTIGTITEGSSGVLSAIAEHWGAHNKGLSQLPTSLSPKYGELRDAFGLEALGGFGISAPVSTVNAITTSSDIATLKQLQNKLIRGTTRDPLTVDEETAINVKIERLDEKLRYSDLSEKHRARLTSKKEELRDQIKLGKPNEDSMSDTEIKKSVDLIRQLEESVINKGIAKDKSNKEKEIKADVKKANKKIKAINKQIVKMQKSEQTEAVVAQIAVKQKQIADFEKSIQIKTGAIQPNADKDAAVTLEDTVAQAKELSNTDINAIDDLDLTELATKVEDVRELLGKSDTQEAIDTLGNLDKIQSDIRNRMLSILGDDASTLETSKDTVLYSLNSIGEDSKEQNKVIKTLLGKSDEEVSPEEKAVLKQRQETLKISNELKTLQDVNKEITVGVGKEKKSFDEHLAQANTEQGMNGLEYFARKMSDKAKVFLRAQQTALETGKTQYINKKNLTTTDKAPVDSKTHWAIFPTSNNPLVDILQKEAEYGQRALNLAKSTVELESNKTESTTAKRNQSIKDILQRSENVKTPKGDLNTVIKKRKAKKEQVNQVIADLTGKTKEETEQPIKTEQAEPVKVAVALDPKTVKDVKAKAKQAVGNKTVADRNLMGDGFNLANTIEENLGKEYADIFRSEVLRLTESNARKHVQAKEKDQQNLFKKEEAEKASTETTSPEVTEPTDESSVDTEVLDTPLITKAGFRKRFAPHGLIKNGRIIPFSEFTELDSDIIIAAAKSLKVCK